MQELNLYLVESHLGDILGLDIAILGACHSLDQSFAISLSRSTLQWGYCAHSIMANYSLDLLCGTCYYGRFKMNLPA